MQLISSTVIYCTVISLRSGQSRPTEHKAQSLHCQPAPLCSTVTQIIKPTHLLGISAAFVSQLLLKTQKEL